jgi:hypothetical protein
LAGATHDDGRERGELVPGELAPVAGWMGNWRDRRFPRAPRSTCEVVLERECGIGSLAKGSVGGCVRVLRTEVEEEAVEAVGLQYFSPMRTRVFWVLPGPTLSAAPTTQELELALMFVFNMQAKVLRRIRCTRRWRISERLAGVKDTPSRWISRERPKYNTQVLTIAQQDMPATVGDALLRVETSI